MSKDKIKPSERTIARAETIIQNRIWECSKKIEQVKERWPEDAYGLRWMEKTDKYEEEIEDLMKYLNAQKTAVSSVATAETAQKTISYLTRLLSETTSKLAEYGEYDYAEKIRRKAGLRI